MQLKDSNPLFCKRTKNSNYQSEKKHELIVAKTTKIPKKGTDCHVFWSNGEEFVYATNVQKIDTNMYTIKDGPRRTYLVRVVGSRGC